MERGAVCDGGCGLGRGQREPLGTALTSHVPSGFHGVRPPCRGRSDDPLPEVPLERLPCRSETLTATAKRLREMSGTAELSQEIPSTDELPTEAPPVVPSPVPPPETVKDPTGIKLPPWLGKWGTGPEKDSPTVVPTLPPTPPTPPEQPSQPVPQRSRLTRDWQKEVVVDPLDSRPGKELGSEDFTHWYGCHGLPIHQFLSSLTNNSTSKDCPPLLRGQGQRKATLASMLYEKYSQETEEELRPRPRRMEAVSTTHRDYRAMGFQSTPQPTTQPHNYLTEQPTSFWLEQARGLPGVTSIFSRNIPFKRNAAFSTPITMYLGDPQPWNLCDPYDSLSSHLQPHKQ